jgi:GTP 3',8-cyclase
MFQDAFGRVHNYLRISITDRCNFRCLYCLPEPEFHTSCAQKSTDMMSADEIFQIAKLFTDHGVSKIRITGGEPLVRKDAGEIMTALGQLPALLTITTNGSRIHQFIDQFIQSGIKSVNVSLDSLNRERFHQLTHRDEYFRVFENIMLLINHGFHVKVNMVVMGGVNDDEILDFVSLTRDFPIHLRFIEFMPFPGNKWQPEKVVTHHQLLEKIKLRFPNIQKLDDRPSDTTRKYQIPDHPGTVAFISTMSEPFCSGCNRIRLTSDGKLRNCLFSKTETDLLTPFRNGEDIVPLIEQTINNKYKQLGGNNASDWGYNETQSQRRSMMGIGG